MENILLGQLSPIAIYELVKQLDIGETVVGTWREFAGYAINATLHDILLIESRQSSPTRLILTQVSNKVGLKMVYMIEILHKINRQDIVEKLRILWKNNELATLEKPDILSEQCTPQIQQCTPQIQQCTPQIQQHTKTMQPIQHHRIVNFPSNRDQLKGETLFLSCSSIMYPCIKRIQKSLGDRGYTVHMDRRRSQLRNQFDHQIAAYFKQANIVICIIDDEYVAEVEGRSSQPLEKQMNIRFILQMMNCAQHDNQLFIPYLLVPLKNPLPPYLTKCPEIQRQLFDNIITNEIKTNGILREQKITQSVNVSQSGGIYQHYMHPPVLSDNRTPERAKESTKERSNDEFVLMKGTRSINDHDLNTSVVITKQPNNKPSTLKKLCKKLRAKKNQPCCANDMKLTISVKNH